ncbi:MAG: hypothetical protein RIC55_09315 [Pirellulaceae bacterium]
MQDCRSISSIQLIERTKLKASEFVGRLRSTQVEEEIASSLHKMSPEESFRFIVELVDVHELVALELAKRTLRKKQHLVQLLEFGLLKANASSMRWWLEAVIPQLGVRRVISELMSRVDTHPKGVSRSYYFLTRWVTKSDDKGRDSLERLHAALDVRGLLRKPNVVKNSDGSISLNPIE